MNIVILDPQTTHTDFIAQSLAKYHTVFTEIENINVKTDLVIPLLHNYQMRLKFRAWINKLKIPCLMPSLENSYLEWSKIKSKQLLLELGIPTPSYKIYTTEDLLVNFYNIPRPFVLKYEQDFRFGLQTIIITDENYKEEYEKLIANGLERIEIMKYKGPFVNLFIVEEYINGEEEISYHALCNEHQWSYLGSARDYKRRYENDIGYNTDGMGSYSIGNNYPIIDQYANSIIQHLKSQGNPYMGFFYLGIIISNGVPFVLEINTRPGCPEIQSILPTIDNELGDLFLSVATNKPFDIKFNDKKAVTVLVQGKLKNKPIDLICGCSKTRDEFTLTAIDTTITNASDKIYNYLKLLDNCEYRKDIGYLK